MDRSRLFGVPRHAALAGVANAVNFAALLMFRPLVPVVLTRLGASHGLVGLIMAGFAVVPLFLAIPMGTLVDRFGARPFVILGSLFMSASMVVVVVHPTIATYAISQIVAGTAQLALVIACQTLTSRVPDRLERERSLSLYTTSVSAGQLVGPIPGGALADAYGFPAAFLTGAAVSLVPILIGWGLPGRAAARGEGVPGEARKEAAAGRGEARSRDASRRPDARQPLSEMLRLPGVRLAMLSSFALILALGVRQTFFAIYVQDLLGYSATFFTVLLSLRAIAAIVVRVGMSGLIRAMGGRHALLVAGMGVAALALAVTPVTRTPLTLVVVSLVLGMATGVIQPLSMLAVADSTPESQRGRAMGLRLTGNRMAQFAGPALFGAVAGTVGIGGGFVVGGALLALATALVIPQRSAYAEARPGARGA